MKLTKRDLALGAGLAVMLGGALTWWRLQPAQREVEQRQLVASAQDLERHCAQVIGAPRVEQITDTVWVARGYDLANTILVRTAQGNVVIDAGMSPQRAQEAREALLERSPGPTLALIYTHSHIDHVGGASAWIQPQTQIWATEAFAEHFLKQYSEFRPAETARAARQFGVHTSPQELPCSGLGRRIDLEAASRTGARMPTHTFQGQQTLELGGVTFDLREAHGETHDQLMVWLPQQKVLLPGDNYYQAFPNLYTIRGTAPRPVEAWIQSLDRMRRLEPAHLVPSHTAPLSDPKEIQRQLTLYRDAIQWVRDRVVAGANRGDSIEALAHSVGLPPHLAAEPSLQPLYGQVDWSVRAIYGQHLGWFDGRPEALYPLAPQETARRSLALMGGADKVWEQIHSSDDPRWSAHLLSLLRDAQAEDLRPGGRWALAMAKALRESAQSVGNSNGRGYLLESALELERGAPPLPRPQRPEALLDQVPIEVFFQVMASRLLPEQSLEVHEAVHFSFTDTQQEVYVTLRRGVAEVALGEPLPGMPAPVAHLSTTTGLWRRLALRQISPVEALASGQFKLEGDQAAFYTFSQRFQAEE